MQALKEEVVVEKNKYFVCTFLDNEKQCLVEKKKCPQDRKDCEKCRQVEDMMQ